MTKEEFMLLRRRQIRILSKDKLDKLDQTEPESQQSEEEFESEYEYEEEEEESEITENSTSGSRKYKNVEN
eukprot:CAMPEP_0205806850 /NCGR_PEP_ID=MMETSP0205-20121125/10488_1 /ASSEMBLY_ACC=CAM_ASM_000278 /TAXON_ID=36767 /ORGANISM="Euplotes focardii, Strain TN1" /LENGTH=70 /DNA_ID=CAMNT_0053080309 /DNA_START=419 /DNA_END=631 /DNA_ORIENTATION=+